MLQSLLLLFISSLNCSQRGLKTSSTTPCHRPVNGPVNRPATVVQLHNPAKKSSVKSLRSKVFGQKSSVTVSWKSSVKSLRSRFLGSLRSKVFGHDFGSLRSKVFGQKSSVKSLRSKVFGQKSSVKSLRSKVFGHDVKVASLVKFTRSRAGVAGREGRRKTHAGGSGRRRHNNLHLLQAYRSISSDGWLLEIIRYLGCTLNPSFAWEPIIPVG